eukprot:s121_g23.t1
MPTRWRNKSNSKKKDQSTAAPGIDNGAGTPAQVLPQRAEHSATNLPNARAAPVQQRKMMETKTDLILSWSPKLSKEPQVASCAAQCTVDDMGYAAEISKAQGLPSTPQGTHFRLAAAVKWATRKLEMLQIPECTGFQRFKAEVGLAELALYALRSCRLGTPAALWRQLLEAEQRLMEALR